MSISPIASLIRRFLLHKVETQEEQTVVEVTDEDVQQTQVPPEGQQDSGHLRVCLTDDNAEASEVGNDAHFSSLFSTRHSFEALSFEENSFVVGTTDTKWPSAEDHVVDEYLSLHDVSIGGFTDLAASNLSQHSPFDLVREVHIDAPSYQHTPLPVNHYHPDSDPSDISLPEPFVQPIESAIVVASNEYVSEIEQHNESVEAADVVVGNALTGEVLNDGNVEQIYFYDGEPIKLGVPIVLDSVDDTFSSHVVEGGEASSEYIPVKGHVIGITGTPLRGVALTLDAGKADEDFVIDLAEFHPRDTILIKNFEMGSDTLNIKTLLGTEESMETLWDNSPIAVNKGGEDVLGFSVERDVGETCTVAFVGLTHDEYMEFLSTAMHKVIDC